MDLDLDSRYVLQPTAEDVASSGPCLTCSRQEAQFRGIPDETHAQVRVDAVAALRNLVDAFHEDDLPSIQPLIPNLLNQLFALMNEVRSSALIPSFQHHCALRFQYLSP